jgi:hypothetical protein
MLFPTTYSSKELDAVNQILGSVGQAPVTVLEETNPEVALAYTTLIEVSKEVQAEGWVFNREFNYPLKPDSSGQIKIPSNALQVDLSHQYGQTQYDSIWRDGKLYDKIRHSYDWEDKEYYADILWYFNFEDLPQVFRAYITARAATICSQRLVGDGNLFQALGIREQQARAFCIEYECNQGDYSMFGFPRGEDYYTSYQPYHTLRR